MDYLKRTVKFRENYYEQEKATFEKLQAGQNPWCLFVACSDSRVVPNIFMRQGMGEIFALRVVANIIPPYEEGVSAVGCSIEYAVAHLHVPHIIICGHMKCGGVMALDEDPGHLEEHIVDWIKYARPAKEAIDSEQAELEEAARHRAIVERNTLLQVENLKSYPVVQEAMEKGELKLHAWLYELENGYVRYYDAINGGYVFP